MGGLNFISVALRVRWTWNFATGSVSVREPEYLVPQSGIVGRVTGLCDGGCRIPGSFAQIAEVSEVS
jgi:hypothetical protein